MIKHLLAGGFFFLSLAALLIAQTFSGVSLIGVRLGAQGGGDVVGPSSSVDSEVALYSGTTGKLLKRATGTGLATLASGVLGVQTAGTPNNCVKWAAGGLLADAGSPCGAGGGGGGSYAAGDGIDGTSLGSGTISVDTTVPVLVVAGSQSLTFGTISSGAISTQTITASGAAVGDPVQMGYPASLPDGLIAIAYVSATDTVTVKLYKATAGSADVSGLTFSYQVWRTR